MEDSNLLKLVLDFVSQERSPARSATLQERLRAWNPEVLDHRIALDLPGDILPLLRARQKISKRAGKVLWGVNDTISALEKYDPASTVCNVTLRSNKLLGNVFMKSKFGPLIGVVLVELP